MSYAPVQLLAGDLGPMAAAAAPARGTKPLAGSYPVGLSEIAVVLAGSERERHEESASNDGRDALWPAP